MSNAFFGKGTQLQVETSPGSGTYQTIPEARSISGPSFEAEEVDVTNMDSSGSFREKIRGLIDPGEIETEINFNPNDSVHQQVLADLKAGTKRNYRIRFAQLTPVYNLTFQAFVRGFPWTIPVDAAVTARVTLALTNEPILASE